MKTELIEIEIDAIREIATGGSYIGIFLGMSGPLSTYISYDSRWLERYASERLGLVDPQLVWAQSSSGVIRWSDISGFEKTNFYNFASDEGFKYGAVCSIKDEERHSFGTFVQKDREFGDLELRVLRDSLQRLHIGHLPHSVFSDIEIEVLKLLSQGHTSKEISQILAVTDQTVKVRITSMKQKVGAESKEELMYLSAKMNII